MPEGGGSDVVVLTTRGHRSLNDVAGREPLIDARNVAADVERVCPHSAYRRRGVARAAIGSRRMTHSPGSTVPPSIAATVSNPKRR